MERTVKSLIKQTFSAIIIKKTIILWNHCTSKLLKLFHISWNIKINIIRSILIQKFAQSRYQFLSIRSCKRNRLIWVCVPRHAYSRKKSTSRKYDPPYVKKPIAKSFAGGSTTSNNSQEDISLDGGKMHSFNNTFR